MPGEHVLRQLIKKAKADPTCMPSVKVLRPDIAEMMQKKITEQQEKPKTILDRLKLLGEPKKTMKYVVMGMIRRNELSEQEVKDANAAMCRIIEDKKAAQLGKNFDAYVKHYLDAFNQDGDPAVDAQEEASHSSANWPW